MTDTLNKKILIVTLCNTSSFHTNKMKRVNGKTGDGG